MHRKCSKFVIFPKFSPAAGRPLRPSGLRVIVVPIIKQQKPAFHIIFKMQKFLFTELLKRYSSTKTIGRIHRKCSKFVIFPKFSPAAGRPLRPSGLRVIVIPIKYKNLCFYTAQIKEKISHVTQLYTSR